MCVQTENEKECNSNTDDVINRCDDVCNSASEIQQVKICLFCHISFTIKVFLVKSTANVVM